MSTEVKGFAEHFSGFKRHLKLAAATFSVILALGVGFAYSISDVYESKAFILIEEPDIPEEIIRTTVTTYAARQLTFLSEKILTISNLVRIIE
jgi:succinoglycan biosynthesis transport protein ExoP